MIDQLPPSLATLFAEASMLPSKQWPEFFDRRCPDAATRRQLERLLAADQQADAFFDGLRNKLTVPRLEESNGERLEDGIAYRLTTKEHPTQLDEDQDAMPRKAAQPGSTHRAETVEALAPDPRTAPPPPLRLGAFRWVARHPGATLITAVLLALSVTSLAWSWLAATNAQERAEQLALERDQARSTQQFLLSLFDLDQDSLIGDSADPVVNGTATTTPLGLHEVLERAVQRLGPTAREPTNPSLHRTIARAYEAAGNEPSALRHLRLASSAVAAESGSWRIEIAIDLARLELAAGNPESIAKRLRALLSSMPNTPNAAHTLGAKELLAEALLQMGTAETIHEATTILRSVVETRRRDTASRTTLPSSLVLLSKVLTARALLERSQSNAASSTIQAGPGSPEAKKLLEEADALFRQGIPVDTFNVEALLAVGSFVLEKGEPERAYRIFDSLQRNVTTIYSARHPLVARALQGRASCLLEMNHLEAAELDYRTSLQHLNDLGHMDRSPAATALTNLGYLLLVRSELEEGEEFLHQAQLPARRPTAKDLSRSHLYLARIVHLRDGATQSLRFYQRALGKLSSQLSLEEGTTIQAQRWFQSARCQAQAQPTKAQTPVGDPVAQLQILESSPAVVASPGAQRAQVMVDLAACLAIVGQPQKAIQTAQSAIDLFERRGLENHRDFTRAIRLRNQLAPPQK